VVFEFIANLPPSLTLPTVYKASVLPKTRVDLGGDSQTWIAWVGELGVVVVVELVGAGTAGVRGKLIEYLDSLCKN
jgi:hypothetical protein